MNFLNAFRLERSTCLAVAGAGGKTSTLFALARLYEPPVLVAAGAHLATWQLRLADRHFSIHDPAELNHLETGARQGVIVFTGPIDEDTQRAGGLTLPGLEILQRLARDWHTPLLIEADGARQRPLKAPAAHEPAIPPFANAVLVVAGMAGIGQPLDVDHVHRPEIFAGLAGLAPGVPVTLEGLRRVLVAPRGGLKNIPAGARRLALLTGADNLEKFSQAAELAKQLLGAYQAAGISGPLEAAKNDQNQQVAALYEPTAGILLAAGAAKRMGQPKLLLPWHGEPLVRLVARRALLAGLNPVVVVTGAYPEAIETALAGLPVRFCHNSAWESGQSSSVRAGLDCLSEETGGALFLLGDQPFISTALIDALLSAHALSRTEILAPYVGKRRANPVLFDRCVFTDLRQLHGDTGGRSLFARYPPAVLPWPDEKILLDVDTPQDYQNLLDASLEG